MRGLVIVEDDRDVGYVTEDRTAVYRGHNPFWYGYVHDINTKGLSDPTIGEDSLSGELLLDRVERSVDGMEFGDYDAGTETRRVNEFDSDELELPKEPLYDDNPFRLKGDANDDRSDHPDLPEDIMDSTAFDGS